MGKASHFATQKPTPKVTWFIEIPSQQPIRCRVDSLCYRRVANLLSIVLQKLFKQPPEIPTKYWALSNWMNNPMMEHSWQGHPMCTILDELLYSPLSDVPYQAAYVYCTILVEVVYKDSPTLRMYNPEHHMLGQKTWCVDLMHSSGWPAEAHCTVSSPLGCYLNKPLATSNGSCGLVTEVNPDR